EERSRLAQTRGYRIGGKMIILRGYSITGQKIFEEHFASGDQESDTISAEVKCIGLRKLLPEGKVTVVNLYDGSLMEYRGLPIEEENEKVLTPE
ncbi:MAG: hypothetical protein ACRDQW_18620, partial [Haloechinothrix sp.]